MEMKSEKQELTKYALLLIEKVKIQNDILLIDLQRIKLDY